MTRSDDGGRNPATSGSPAPDETREAAKLRERLENVLLWLRTAKENLPDMNDGRVPADRLAAASGLVDRMHQVALDVASNAASRGQRQRRAA